MCGCVCVSMCTMRVSVSVSLLLLICVCTALDCVRVQPVVLFISYRISEQRAAQPSAWWWCSAALVQSVLRADKHRALITAICGSIALHQPGRLANGWPSAPLNKTGSPPRSDPRKHRPSTSQGGKERNEGKEGKIV